MEISQSQSSTVFSVRIVSIDYNMAPPIPGVDFCYSSFHGGKINEVPVIRIYGSTPAGQKTCLHVHQALPYLYVPCSELFPGQQQGEAFANDLCLAIEKSLKLKGNAGSKRQHVHGYSLVRAKRFYGYHLSEDVFVKIYLYYPHDVSRAANLLLGGAVLDKRLQPHESHIPFLLQFLIDYNLYGMGHLHLSKIKFRHPIPVTVASRKVNYIQKHGLETEKLTCTSADLKADPSDDAALHLPIWISSTIPGDWMWQFPSESDTSQDQGNHCKRQSVCELEGDTTVDEILNQQLKMFTSLSQTHSDVKMVQSLVSIWEEEYERTGMHQVPMPSDPSKPLPEEVLRVFSLGLDYEKKLIELCDKQDTLDLLTPSEKDEKFLGSKTSSSDQEIVIEHGPVRLDSINVEPLRSSMEMDGYLTSQGSLYKDRKALSVKKHGSPKLLSVNEKRVTPKGDDEEAIGLLSWLATSQAAEDINSDDELLRETILSPLFPAATFDKVLEKANVDYEHASQKECKDILDSTAELVDFEGFEERSFHPSNSRHSSLPSSENIIPQVDGAGDDMFQTPPSRSARMSPEINVKSKNTRSSKNHVLDDMLWGSLPITSNEKVCDDLKSTSFSSADACIDDTKDSVSSSSLDGKKRKQEDAVMKSVDSKKCGSKEKSTLVECPLRDLMRRKRCYRPEPLECGPHKDDKATSPGSLKDFFPEKSDSHMLQYDELNTAFNDSLFKEPSLTDQPTKLDKSCDINPASSDCSMDAKPPIFYRSDGPLQASSLDDGHFDSDIKVDETIGVAGSSQFGYFAVTGPSQVNKCPLLSTSMVISTEAEHKDLIGMTFCKRPPTADWTNEDTIFTHLLAISDASSALKEINIDKTSGRPLPDFLPFFVREGNTLANNSESDYPQEVTMGIPTHYQNDGSLLYLLTPVSSPPSADCVRRWLLCDQRDSSRRIGSEKSLFNKCDESMSRAGSVLQMRSINELEHQGDLGNLNVDKNPKDGTTIIKSGGGNLDVKSCSDWSLDISQISGPDGKSKCTPLSQRGFRDSASVGGGQQLTLLSIEVQAESRGDRRPDPQHDAVNVIALVIQNDDDPSVEVHVLLYSKADSFKRSLDGISGCNMMVFSEEKCLFQNFVKIICSADPDMLLGWDIQGGSLGYLAERASQLGIGLLNKISRIPSEKKLGGDSEASHKGIEDTLISDLVVDSDVLEDVVIEDEWGRTHASGVHVDGRIVLNVWRLMRSEVKLNIYTLEAVTEAVLRRKVPLIPHKTLTKWYSSGLGRARFRCIEYVLERAKLNLQIVNQLDMINRTSELARVFGIDFFSVLSRGSQYRVESMLLRLAHTQNYLVVSPGNQQVASQPAMECIPLVMEPESGFYADPVVVLDFQSLYPSMIIAYNLCFCTCLGKLALSKINTLGVSTYSPNLKILQDLKDQMLLTPNGVLYVPAKVRKGILPRLLEEILSTRIMVKQAMKKLAPSQQVLHRIFNARQLALKLIANVTYGYTAAGFSGRMPCAELADSIVQCGRSTLEKAILCVNSHDKWGAKVIYGDTDSMFVLLKGRSVKEAFHIGNEIASAITAMNPSPVTLKMEKVYHRCFLLTKKRYVGYSYENPEQTEPIFDAKGIETVRRDTCPAVAKTMEKSLRLFFEHQDILEVKAYLQRQWKRILSGRVSLQDFIFAKEVRLGTYRTRTSSSLPPAAIVATKATRVDPRAEPRYAERVPYVVIHGEPGARLVDMVVDPLDLLAVDTPYRLNDLYYINKQIIPALQRVFGLVGANLNQWFAEMPRAISEAFAKHPSLAPNPNRTRIDYYYLSERCILCGELVQAMSHLCNQCSQNETVSAIALIRWTSKLEREMQHLAAICQHCGGDGVVERGIKCISLACSVFYERRKVQKELHGLVSVASDKDFYPKCNVEWF